MNAITMQELSEQSQTLLDIAAILPSTFIDLDALRRNVKRREDLLKQEEANAARKEAESRKATALVIWATEVHVRLTTLLEIKNLSAYRATVENHEGTLVVRAPGWDKWKDAEDDFHGILATVAPIRFYTKRHEYRSDEAIEGNFLNVTIAGKTSRHTKPDFRKISESLLEAARENFEFIERRKKEVEARKAKTSKAVETFGAILPLREKRETHTSGSNPRTRSVYHTHHTYIEPKGYLSGGEIAETSEGWFLRLTLNKLDDATAKKILRALSEME